MSRIFRISRNIFLGIALLASLSIPVMGLVSTATGWHGICYGFTDGQWPCGWWEYARNEMFWASFIAVPVLLVGLVPWLGMTFIQAIVSSKNKHQHEH
jgi:hypothetical protein